MQVNALRGRSCAEGGRCYVTMEELLALKELLNTIELWLMNDEEIVVLAQR